MRNASRTGQKAVLITGCASGIGRATALCLAQGGFTVFATVRRERDAEALKCIGIETLVPLCPLDLCDTDQIARITDTVEEALSARGIEGLYAVVHNAGGGSIAPIELMDLAGFRTELIGRLLGPVALLQQLLPRIREAHGRIVWIATPALIPTRYVSSIHACDFAVNCLARTLRIELAPWHIPNILVRCGGIATASPEKSARELETAMRAWPEDRARLYAGALKQEMEFLARFDQKRTPAEAVAEAVCTALTAKKPKTSYRVGYMAVSAGILELLPQAWADAIIGKR